MGSVSSYDGQSFKINDEHKKDVFDDENKIKDATDWQNANNKTIITPVGSLDELEKQWRDFNSMIKKHRRESDWKCIEIFGMTNQDIYDKLKSYFLSDNIKRYDDYESIDAYLQAEDQPIVESFAMDSDIDSIMSYYDNDHHTNITYTGDDVTKAKEWSMLYNRFIIMPVKSLVDLEALWDAYSSMIHKHKRESDWKSIELFGMNNLEHYKKLKTNLLKNDISEEDQTLYDDLVSESITVYDSPKMIAKYLANITDSPRIDIAKCILEQYSKNNTVYDEILTINGITEIIDNCDDLITNNAEIGVEYGELPYYSPEEMIDMGVFGQASINYYGEKADNDLLSDNVTTFEWFKAYKESTINKKRFISYIPDWIDKVRSLYYELCNSIKNNDDDSIINRKKQSLLELGWNPDINFSDRSRSIIKDININKETFITKFIDLREFVTSFNKQIEDDEIKPVYVVLSEGKRIISSIIKNVTKDKYSHVSISFDPNLKTMYSFADNGITEESIDNIKDACRIRVFSFFIKPDTYLKIKENVNYYLKNRDLTHYSYLNLFAFLFNVNYEKEWKLICSQFVDKVLKMANLDLTNKQSALTSPSTFNHSLKDKRNVYTLYIGLAKDYDGNRISSLINGLRSKATVLESSRVLFNDEYTYLRAVISNINNVDRLRNLKEFSNLVSNEKIKTILEKYVFINIEPYYNESESENSSINKLNFLIEKYMRPL